MKDLPWYKSFRSSQLLMVHLVQCDLARHTAWFSRCIRTGHGAGATKAKKELANDLEKAVAPSFAKVFWRGDGGMYAAKQEGTTGDDVVIAAFAIHRTFLSWQRSPKWSALHLEQLALRLCCHTCNVWVGDAPAYWTSLGLNRFVKYERRLSHEETLAITHTTFEHLKTMGPQFAKCTKPVYVNDEEPEEWMVHYSSQVSPEKAVQTTVDWFKEKFGASIQIDDQVVAESQRFALGESIVLHITGSPDETLDLELKEEKLPAFDFPSEREQRRWKSFEEKIVEEIRGAQEPQKQVDLEKASPLELRMPLKDFPIAKITYCPTRYSRARSFLQYLAEDHDLWEWYANQGVDYAPDAPRRPGILCAHLILITNEGEQGPYVVLAQRSKRQKEEVGFHRGRWSVTLEEQVERNDGTIRATVTRGLKEELLGGEVEKTSINVAALFLERSYLNLSAGVVCRTSLSFEEIHSFWRTCVDRDEHSQIVALPLKERLIRECIGAGELTSVARDECQVQDNFRNVWENTRGWALHPTSAFRLALSLRAIQAQ